MFKYFRKKKNIQLIAVLNRTINYLETSEESDYSVLESGQIIILKSTIESLSCNGKFDKLELKVLFAVTSDIQEISVRNNWADELIELASEFDEYIYKIMHNKAIKNHALSALDSQQVARLL